MFGAVRYSAFLWLDLAGRVCASQVAELRIRFVPTQGWHPVGAPIPISGPRAQAGWAHLGRAFAKVPSSRTKVSGAWGRAGTEIPPPPDPNGYSIEVREEGQRDFNRIRLFAYGRDVRLALLPDSVGWDAGPTYFAPDFVDWLMTEVENARPGGSR